MFNSVFMAFFRYSCLHHDTKIQYIGGISKFGKIMAIANLLFPLFMVGAFVFPLNTESFVVGECLGLEDDNRAELKTSFCEETFLRKYFYCHWSFGAFCAVLIPFLEMAMYIYNFVFIFNQTQGIKHMISNDSFRYRKR